MIRSTGGIRLSKPVTPVLLVIMIGASSQQEKMVGKTSINTHKLTHRSARYDDLYLSTLLTAYRVT